MTPEEIYVAAAMGRTIYKFSKRVGSVRLDKAVPALQGIGFDGSFFSWLSRGWHSCRDWHKTVRDAHDAFVTEWNEKTLAIKKEIDEIMGREVER